MFVFFFWFDPHTRTHTTNINHNETSRHSNQSINQSIDRKHTHVRMCARLLIVVVLASDGVEDVDHRQRHTECFVAEDLLAFWR